MKPDKKLEGGEGKMQETTLYYSVIAVRLTVAHDLIPMLFFSR